MGYVKRPAFEEDDATFDADAYRVRGYRGVACYVLGWETEPDEDTEWSGYEQRTGRVVCVMVGDDSRFCVDVDDVEPMAREDYCGGCGQVGCTADAYDRGDD